MNFYLFFFVSSVLKFNNDVYGLGPFLSILLIFGSSFNVEINTSILEILFVALG